MSGRDFSLSGYRQLLSDLRGVGYHYVDFHGVTASNVCIISRHDIDYSLEYAVKIGAIDESQAVHSTFFVMLGSQFYSPFSRPSRAALRELVAQGHEIGLHFDRSIYDGDEAALEAAAYRECAILEDLVGCAVRVTAFHRPAQTPEVLGRPGLFAGRLHAYAPEFFNQIGYVSDGAGYWSHGHPLDQPAIKARTAIQILTHPYLWVGDVDRSAIDSIEQFRREREAFMISELRRNLRYYPKE